MNRELFERIQAYFAMNVVEDDCVEQQILDELNKEADTFEIAFLNKSALERHGYDTSDLSDDDMNELAAEMGDMYCDSRFSSDLHDACQKYGVARKPCCPMCREVNLILNEDGSHTCADCDLTWGDDYVLVVHPEETQYFFEEGIGYPSFNQDDNGARYIPVADYINYFGKVPEENQYYSPISWPDSQQYLELPDNLRELCENIESGEAFEDFGPSALWVPKCLTDR